MSHIVGKCYSRFTSRTELALHSIQFLNFTSTSFTREWCKTDSVYRKNFDGSHINPWCSRKALYRSSLCQPHYHSQQVDQDRWDTPVGRRRGRGSQDRKGIPRACQHPTALSIHGRTSPPRVFLESKSRDHYNC
jgi:hypothetical protein